MRLNSEQYFEDIQQEIWQGIRSARNGLKKKTAVYLFIRLNTTAGWQGFKKTLKIQQKIDRIYLNIEEQVEIFEGAF